MLSNRGMSMTIQKVLTSSKLGRVLKVPHNTIMTKASNQMWVAKARTAECSRNRCPSLRLRASMLRVVIGLSWSPKEGLGCQVTLNRCRTNMCLIGLSLETGKSRMTFCRLQAPITNLWTEPARRYKRSTKNKALMS